MSDLVDGYIESLNVATSLHTCGFIHRDLKEDNIAIHPETKAVSLIDLEYCVELGPDGIFKGEEDELNKKRLSPEALWCWEYSVDSDTFSLVKLAELILEKCKDKLTDTEKNLLDAVVGAYDVSLPRECRKSAKDLYEFAVLLILKRTE
ncbi:hypothetical protein HDU97_009049 [Phlyctochytrium planicorne]|nr:hypothetical protein HDU97_009049 [Phlyctochytrium planicorne]